MRRRRPPSPPDRHDEALRWAPTQGAALEVKARQLGKLEAQADFPDEDIGTTLPPSARYLFNAGLAAVEESKAEHAARIGLALAETEALRARLSHQLRLASEAEFEVARLTDREEQLREQLPEHLRERAEEGAVSLGSLGSASLNTLLIVGETSLTKTVFDILGAAQLPTWGIALATQAMLIAGAHHLGALTAGTFRGAEPLRRRWLVWIGLVLVACSGYLAAVRAGRLVLDVSFLERVGVTAQPVGWRLGFGMFCALQLGFLAVAALNGFRRHGPQLAPLKAVRSAKRKAMARAREEWEKVDELLQRFQQQDAKLTAADVRWDAFERSERHRARAAIDGYMSTLITASDVVTAASLAANDLLEELGDRIEEALAEEGS